MVQHSPPPPLARRGRRRPLQGLLKHVLHQEAEILEILKGREEGGLRASQDPRRIIYLGRQRFGP